jgi:hypothetical protein
MSEDELQELKACLRPMDFAAAPLFCQGDAGSSMYIVQEGQVEGLIAEGLSCKRRAARATLPSASSTSRM